MKILSEHYPASMGSDMKTIKRPEAQAPTREIPSANRVVPEMCLNDILSPCFIQAEEPRQAPPVSHFDYPV